jgi:hypothetical protein
VGAPLHIVYEVIVCLVGKGKGYEARPMGANGNPCIGNPWGGRLGTIIG